MRDETAVFRLISTNYSLLITSVLSINLKSIPNLICFLTKRRHVA